MLIIIDQVDLLLKSGRSQKKSFRILMSKKTKVAAKKMKIPKTDEKIVKKLLEENKYKYF